MSGTAQTAIKICNVPEIQQNTNPKYNKNTNKYKTNTTLPNDTRQTREARLAGPNLLCVVLVLYLLYFGFAFFVFRDRCRFCLLSGVMPDIKLADKIRFIRGVGLPNRIPRACSAEVRPGSAAFLLPGPRGTRHRAALA
jgi:hypothetical protein